MLLSVEVVSPWKIATYLYKLTTSIESNNLMYHCIGRLWQIRWYSTSVNINLYNDYHLVHYVVVAFITFSFFHNSK